MSISNAYPHQRPFLRNTYPISLADGGWRSGKTWTGASRLLKHAVYYGGSRGAVGVTSMERHARSVIMPTLIKQEYRPVFRIESHIWNNYIIVRSRNGNSRIDFFPMSKNGDEEKFINDEFDYCWLDNAVMMNEHVFDYFYPSRLSGRTGPTPTRIWITTHSGHSAHWLIKKAKKYNWQRYTLKTEDNPLLDDTYIKRMKENYTGAMRRRYMMGDWIDLEDAFFDYSTLRQYEGDSDTDRFQNIVCWCDPASSVNGDYACVAAMGLLNGEFIILDVERGKGWYIDDHKRVIKRFVDKWNPSRFGVEANGFQEQLVRETERDVPIVEPIKVHRDKQARAWPLQNLWNKGLVKWNIYDEDIYDEVCSFPQAEHDDVVDCLSGCYQLLGTHIETVPQPTIPHKYIL